MIIVVQVRLHTGLSQLLILAEMKPEPDRRAVNGQMVHASQYSFAFIHFSIPSKDICTHGISMVLLKIQYTTNLPKIQIELFQIKKMCLKGSFLPL